MRHRVGVLSSIAVSSTVGSEGLNLVFQSGMSRSPRSSLFPLTSLLRAGDLCEVFEGRGCQGQWSAVLYPGEEL